MHTPTTYGVALEVLLPWPSVLVDVAAASAPDERADGSAVGALFLGPR